MFAPYKVVLTNPQSYLCGIIGAAVHADDDGDMIWACRSSTASAWMRARRWHARR